MSEPGPLQRLLAATDLSARADRAFDRAVQLARTSGARLTVLHVIPDELQPDLAEALKAQARMALEALVAQALAAGHFDVEITVKGGLDQEEILEQVAEGAARGDLSVEIRIEAGSIYDIIDETAAQMDADLVICGTHRSLLIGDEWLGSTIDRVLRFGKRPVLVVKTKPAGAYESIIVGIDFSECSATALEFAVKAFPGARFTLLHAIESSLSGFLAGAATSRDALERHTKELLQFSDKVLRRADAVAVTSVNTEIRYGEPASVLQQYAAEHSVDLVVVGTHGRTGIRRAILGSVAESSIASLPCDVLAVRRQAT